MIHEQEIHEAPSQVKQVSAVAFQASDDGPASPAEHVALTMAAAAAEGPQSVVPV